MFADQYNNYAMNFGSDKVSDSVVNIRLGFLRKVYGIVSAQLLITTAVAAIFLTFQPIRVYLSHTWIGFMILIGAAIMSLVFIGALKFTSREYPQNYICLALFTGCEALLVGSFVTYYTLDSVLMAFVLTCIVTCALTAYAMKTDKDFSAWGAGMISILMNIILLGLFNIWLQNRMIHICLTGAGAVLFSLYIIYDVNMIMKKVSPEEYVLAAATLYLDIINLFVKLLELFGERRQK